MPRLNVQYYPTYTFIDNNKNSKYCKNESEYKINKYKIVAPENRIKNNDYYGLVKKIYDSFSNNNDNDCIALVKIDNKYQLRVKNSGILLSTKKHASNFFGASIKDVEIDKYQKYLGRNVIHNAVRAEYGSWVIWRIERALLSQARSSGVGGMEKFWKEINVGDLRIIYHMAEHEYKQYEFCSCNARKSVIDEWNKLDNEEKWKIYQNIFNKKSCKDTDKLEMEISSDLRSCFYTRDQLRKILGISSAWIQEMTATYGIPAQKTNSNDLQTTSQGWGDDDGWNCNNKKYNRGIEYQGNF
jgi:hypothetical protein